MVNNNLLLPIWVPVVFAFGVFVFNGKKWLREIFAVLGTLIFLFITWNLFSIRAMDVYYRVPWAGFGMSFDLRLYSFSGFILLWLGIFTLIVTLFSTVKLVNHPRANLYYTYIFLTACFGSGAVLSNNFVLMVFFWEGLLLTLYGFICLGGENSYRTAVKSLIIVGLCDFSMILGIGIIWFLTGTFTMSKISLVPSGPAAAAFFLMMAGALGKAGAVPFHTWIPDAADDAPVTFMALIPASIDKLIGIYLLVRLCLDFFVLRLNDPFSITLMVIGGLTILITGFMAFIQDDFKRILSYSTVSQVGYMILGIGTFLPVGITGGLFLMLNHSIYESGLFLSAGSIEHKTGTTRLNKLGGLGKRMPVTAVCFIIFGLSISGIWPFNGFISKEMIIHSSINTGWTIFALSAYIGAILTVAYMLKAGHSIFFGPEPSGTKQVKESESLLLIPMIILAFLCILFGLDSKMPIKFSIAPILKSHFPLVNLNFYSHALSVFTPAAGITILCIIIAIAMYFLGWKKSGGKASVSSESLRYALIFKTLYDMAERKFFDIYEQGIVFLSALSEAVSIVFDRGMDYIYETAFVNTGKKITSLLKSAHNGKYANYLAWLIGGLFIVAWILILKF
ncbi:MAG: NADH-quinone oxidoreductase subunit L [Candidatus Omnitrophica bacterium]|nr:NADH-quinone oxidoreductase subunit L [Candidatus Omnitrophota bacterium]